MAQAPLLNVTQVSSAEPSPPQAMRPDWEWWLLASGSEGREQMVPLLRRTSTDAAPAPVPPVKSIPSIQDKKTYLVYLHHLRTFLPLVVAVVVVAVVVAVVVLVVGVYWQMNSISPPSK